VQVGPALIDPGPALRVVLVQALPKGERSELAVDLATEAGVDTIVPWQAARCVARWTGSPDKAIRGRERWQSVAREAAKQSRRTRVPTVLPLASTTQVAQLVGRSAGALVLHEAGSSPLTSAPIPDTGELVLVVGPEGGIAPEELAAFTDAGAAEVRLGREVLRTSTAAAVALGALGVLTGRWG
jgi:16S rRNA (uracil1498-N3)-methyltransferase